MLNLSWIKKLKDQVRFSKPSEGAPRIALVGIGSELDGDDAAGVAVLRQLSPLLVGGENLLLVDAGPVPENFTGPLRRFQPDWVILVDAGNFGGEPGEIRLIDWRAAEGFSGSTHTLPISVFAAFLESELNCQAALVAVQAGNIGFDQPMTAPVGKAVAELVEGLEDFLKQQ